MESGVHKLAVICFLIVGLSHIVQPRTWVDFFISLREKGKIGVFITAFIHLPLGVLIVGFHNVWTGIPCILTVMGWCWVLKSFLYFVFPSVGLRGLALVSVEHAGRFRIAGVFLLVLGLVLSYPLL